jgi:hypothetical protein
MEAQASGGRPGRRVAALLRRPGVTWPAMEWLPVEWPIVGLDQRFDRLVGCGRSVGRSIGSSVVGVMGSAVIAVTAGQLVSVRQDSVGVRSAK